MSGLYGLIRVDGRPVAREQLAAMARAMASWGPDGGGSWSERGAGLGQVVAHRTPASAHEDGPVSGSGGQVVTAVAARLDNRDELCAALDVAPPRRPSTPDGQLIAAAYERWGMGAATRLFGDWAFAAYHVQERRLFLARDHYGQTALYYHYDGRAFAFASSLKSLLALPHVPWRLNELGLAQHLVPWPVDGAPTLYEGINRLPPAHMLTLADASLSTREFWRPQDAPEVRLESDDAYVERFVELFAGALRTRLPATGPVASTLSAGLDSAAVTGFAATELARRGGALTAFTATPAHPEVADALPGELVDEWLGAQSVAARYANVDHVRVTGQDIAPLQAIARSHEIHDELEWGVANLPWILAMLEQSRSRGAQVLLTGQTGNGGISWAGGQGSALRLLASGNPRGALRAIAERHRAPGVSWPLAVRRELAGPLRHRLGAELERWRRARDGRLVGPLIEPEFARRLDLAARIRDDGFDPTFARATDEQRRIAILLPGVTPMGALWHEHGAAYGLDVRDPTADVRVLEFCFGIPRNQFLRGVDDRWLIRRGLQGLAPPEVQWNRRRGQQGADIAYRLRADADAVAAALERIEASPLVRSYLNLGALRKSWDAVRRVPAAPVVTEAAGLARGLSAGLFLRRFER